MNGTTTAENFDMRWMPPKTMMSVITARNAPTHALFNTKASARASQRVLLCTT